MADQFKNLFSPIKVGSMTVPNRIVETAHGVGIGRADGLPDDRFIAYHAKKARNGTGWIGNQGISIPHPLPYAFPMGGLGGASRARLMVHQRPDFVERYRKFVDAIHDLGAVVTAQLIFMGDDMGPSPVQWSPTTDQIPHEMDQDEINAVLQSFAEVSARCREAGIDGVEFHASHTAIAEWFLSPLSNRRTDEYGGSLENRLRFPLQVIDSIRSAVGNDYVVGMRLNADQFDEQGYNLEHTKRMAAILSKRLDFFDIDVGTYWGNPSYIQPMYYPLGAFVYTGAAIKEMVDIPVIFAGRINDPVQAERVIADGQADLVAMVRAGMVDPEFPRKAREGRLDEIRKCIGCNHCIRLVVHNNAGLLGGTKCATNPEMGRELDWPTYQMANPKKRIVIVGGGPAGLETARVARERGHDIILLERGPELGGQLNIAAKAPSKEGFLDFVRYQAYQMKLLGVDVRLNTDATAESILALKPDAVVIATGSVPHIPDISGIHQPNVVDVRDVLSGKVTTGQNVVVVCREHHYDGASVADFLASQGRKVEMLHFWVQVGGEIDRYTKSIVYFRLHSGGVKITLSTAVRAIEGNTVVAYNVHTGEERRIEGVDTVVLACGSQGDSNLYKQLQGNVKELHIIGSAYAGRELLEATQQAAEVARVL